MTSVELPWRAQVLTSVDHAVQRNTDGKQPLKPRGQPVSFQLSAPARAPGLVFATVKLPDLGSTTPKADPSAPSGSNKQADLPISPEDAVNAVRWSSTSCFVLRKQFMDGIAKFT